MKNFQRSKTSVVSYRDLEIHDSRNVKLCESPSRAGGLLTINQYSLVSAFLVQIVLLDKICMAVSRADQSRRNRLYTHRRVLFERTDRPDGVGGLGSAAELAHRPVALGIRGPTACSPCSGGEFRRSCSCTATFASYGQCDCRTLLS